MNKLVDMGSRKIFLILLFVVVMGAFLSLYRLGDIPGGIIDDEAAYIYNAYSIWKTGGYDITGQFLPLSTDVLSSIPPVPNYSIAPFVGIFGLSAFTGRLAFALYGIASIPLVFLIARRLFKNDSIALLSAFVFTVSPWRIFVSRMGIEITASLFFYLLAFYIFLAKLKKGNILWSLPAFLLAYNSYHATKIFLFAFVPLLIFLNLKNLLERKKEFVLFILGMFFIIASFFVILKNEKIARQDELVWNNPKILLEANANINSNREKSIAPEKVREIYSNKLLYYLQNIQERYLDIFSPQYLFTGNENMFFLGYDNFFKGQLYLIELPLLILGIAYLFLIKDKKIRYLIFLAILISPLPTAFSSGKEYMFRSVMLLPFLSLLIGCGIYYFFLKIRKNRLFLIGGFSFLSLLYLIMISMFLYQYFFRFGGYGGEFWQKSDADLAQLIYGEKNKFDNVYVAHMQKQFLLQYGFHNQIPPEIIQKAWASSKPQKVDNITFIQECLKDGKGDPNKFVSKKTLYIVPVECYKDIKPSQTIIDSFEPLHTIWKIYEIK